MLLVDSNWKKELPSLGPKSLEEFEISNWEFSSSMESREASGEKKLLSVT